MRLIRLSLLVVLCPWSGQVLAVAKAARQKGGIGKAPKPQKVATTTRKPSPASINEGKLDQAGADRLLQKVRTHCGSFHGNNAHLLGPHLACSACLMSSRELRLTLSHHVKRKYKGDPVRQRLRKEVDLRRGAKAACERKRYPDEMAIANIDPKNLTVFEYREKSEAELLGNWPASSEVVEQLVGACALIVDGLMPAIVERAVYAKRPPWKLEWERWACQEQLRACDGAWFVDKAKTRDVDEWWDEDDEGSEL